MIYERIPINLKSGVKIEILNFHFGYTYENLLAGFPDDRINQIIFELSVCVLLIQYLKYYKFF